MKYCEDCKWIKVQEYYTRQGFCTNPESKRTAEQLVFRDNRPFAKDERQCGNCGPDAKLWEPK